MNSYKFLLTSFVLIVGCTPKIAKNTPKENKNSTHYIKQYDSNKNIISIANKQFITNKTMKIFNPHGVNFVRLAQGIDGTLWHKNFSSAIYNIKDVEDNLNAIKNAGYNVVRVFIDNQEVASESTATLNLSYMDNLSDFIIRASQHNLKVVLTMHWIPLSYESVSWQYPLEASDSIKMISGVNRVFFHPGYIMAYATIWKDIIRNLKSRSILDSLFAIDLWNEPYFIANELPFTHVGNFNFNGISYNLPNDLNSLKYNVEKEWINKIVSEIKIVDRDLLTYVSVVPPRAVGRTGYSDFKTSGDPRLNFGPKALNDSNLDFIGLHIYTWGKNDFSFNLDMQQFTSETGGNFVKPYIVDEYGVNKKVVSSDKTAANILKNLLINGSKIGKAQGWMYWTWDTQNQNFHTLQFSSYILQTIAPNVLSLYNPSFSLPENGEEPNNNTCKPLPLKGVFKVGNALYYSDGQNSYCHYNDWNKFMCATGITDINQITAKESLPTCPGISFHGTCSVQENCNLPACTESNWTSEATTCSRSGQKTITWRKIGQCIGGVSHPAIETSSCTPCKPLPETGLFRVGLGIFYSNGQNAYCHFNDWNKFMCTTGITDANQITAKESLPTCAGISFDGTCTIKPECR